jgi:hypothetical protein
MWRGSSCPFSSYTATNFIVEAWDLDWRPANESSSGTEAELK